MRLYNEQFLNKIREGRKYAINSASDESWPVSYAILKLLEEQGELAEAVLFEVGSMPHKTMKETSHGEAVDCILCILDSFRDEPLHPVQSMFEFNSVQEPDQRLKFFKESIVPDLSRLISFALRLESKTQDQKNNFWNNQSLSADLRELYNRTIMSLCILAEDTSGVVNAHKIMDYKLDKWKGSNETRNQE